MVLDQPGVALNGVPGSALVELSLKHKHTISLSTLHVPRLGMFLEAEDHRLEAGQEEGDQPGEAHHQPRHQAVLLQLEGEEGTADGDISELYIILDNLYFSAKY